MAKPDYQEHQAELERRVAENPALTLKEYCDESGLNHNTARRYLRRPKTTAKVEPKRKVTTKPKSKVGRTKAQQQWVDLLEEFLLRAAKNPTLSMSDYAEEKGVKYPTLRRQFNEMRKDADFDALFDLYDRNLEALSDAIRDRRKKGGDESTALAEQRKTAQTRAAARNESKRENDQFADAQNAQFDATDIPDFSALKQNRFKGLRGRPALHGGYARIAGFNPEIIDALSSIDPLSVSNELLMARAMYANMLKTIHSRLELYEELEGDQRLDELGEEFEIDKERDRLIFGYAPRLRELESSIANLTSIENKRAFDARKQRMDELKLPFHLPNEETQLVISVLELRERNNWDALTTAKHIERLGAKVPPALMMELKAQMEEVEDEVIESGTTIEQLDAITDSYNEEQRIYEEETLPARRLEVAKAIAEAEARENGTDIDGGTIAKAAEDEDTLNEYDALDAASDADDLEGFDVL